MVQGLEFDNPLKIGNAKDIFYQEKFKISNNENIEDITQSRESKIKVIFRISYFMQ